MVKAYVTKLYFRVVGIHSMGNKLEGKISLKLHVNITYKQNTKKNIGRNPVCILISCYGLANIIYWK